MFKRILLGLLVAAIPVLAAAQLQNYIVPTAPPGTKNNQAASTAFVLANDGVFVNPVAFGADPTGVADSAAALNAALAASNNVRFPPGTFKFNSLISYSVPAGGSVTIEGAGDGVTVLTWPAGAGGLSLTLANTTSSFHVRNLTETVGVTAGGNALLTTLTTGSANPALSAVSDITNVTMRGSDGFAVTNYWTTGWNDQGVSNVNVYGLNIFGNNTTGGPAGSSGILINGLVSATQYAVAIQVNFSQFQQVQNALNLQNYWQGVTVQQSQFVGVTFGHITIGIRLGSLVQLTFINNQFNIQGPSCGTGNGCWASNSLAPIIDFFFTNNYVQLSSALASGVQHAGGSSRGFIIGNDFISGSTNQTGVSLASGANSDVIIGDNVFTSSFQVGIGIGAPTSRVMIENNDFSTGIATPVNNASSTPVTIIFTNNLGFNVPWIPYVPTSACGAGTLTSATVAGRYLQANKTTSIQMTFVVTTVGTCTTNVSLALPTTGPILAGPGTVYPISCYDNTSGLAVPCIVSGANVILQGTPAARTYYVNGVFEAL